MRRQVSYITGNGKSKSAENNIMHFATAIGVSLTKPEDRAAELRAVEAGAERYAKETRAMRATAMLTGEGGL